MIPDLFTLANDHATTSHQRWLQRIEEARPFLQHLSERLWLWQPEFTPERVNIGFDCQGDDPGPAVEICRPDAATANAIFLGMLADGWIAKPPRYVSRVTLEKDGEPYCVSIDFISWSIARDVPSALRSYLASSEQAEASPCHPVHT